MSDRILQYYGGKARIAHHIVGLINRVSWSNYVEPFFGSGAVFFAMGALSPKKTYVINDVNDKLITFYRVAKSKKEEFIKFCEERGVHSRTHYRRANSIVCNKEEADDIETAWAVLYAATTAFCGQLKGHWGRAPGESDAFWGRRITNIITKLPAFCDRLKECTIENDDAVKLCGYYDSGHTLIYADPPYVGTSQGSYSGYKQEDFDKLLNFLSGTKAKFILSHYTNDAMLKLVDDCGWHIRKIPTYTTVSSVPGHRDSREELLVYNFNARVLR